MSVVLRPGAAVYAVDEGLLFSGWSSGGLMACSPGVAKLWRTVEPVLRAGVEPEALRERLPDKAATVFDQIVSTLAAHGMLMPVPQNEVPPYLAEIAPDPMGAAQLGASVRLRLTGAATEDSGIGPALTRAGFPPLTDPADATGPVWTVYVGPASEASVAAAVSEAGGAELAVLVLSDAILVGAADDLADAAIGPHLEKKVTDHPQPGAGEWAIARAVVVDHVVRRCAGLTRPPVLIRSGTARRLTDAAEPEPGDLPQLPLAQQRFRGAGQEVVGAGVDQAAAAGDARRAAVRAWAETLPAPLPRHADDPHPADESRTGWTVGPIGAAGEDTPDLWTDAVGRLLVALAARPTDPPAPDLPRSVRWRRAIARRDGKEPTVSCGETMLGVAVAVASSAQRESWGYGADRASAAEHALRGLLVTTPPPGRIAVSHDAGAVAALEPLIGDRGLVAETLPGLRFEPCESPDGAVLAGRIWIA